MNSSDVEFKYFNRIEEFLDNTKTLVLLGFLILLSIFRLLILYSERDGHHVDETWCLGFANSYYNPHIYLDNNGNVQYLDEWIKGETFKDYISVSEDERFAFDSVLYNKKSDLSPALYELILHFVCSFFPDSFSWNYVFLINVFVYVPTLILIFCISYELTSSRFFSFITLVYYVFSGCGTANFLYLRTYHLFTLFTITLFFLFILNFKNHKYTKRISYFILPIVTILGALTHYYFLVIAFYITAFSAIILLIRKKYKDAFILCIIMLLSVVIFFVIYPQALGMLLPYASGETTTGYYSYPYSWNLSVANIHFFTGIIGFYIDISLIGIIETVGFAVFFIIIIFLFSYLFRNEKWFNELKKRIVNFFFSIIKIFRMTCESTDISLLVALLSSIAYLLTIPYSATIYHMGYTERYFFAAMTLFLVAFISILCVVVRNFLHLIKNIIFLISVFALFIGTLCFMCYRSDSLTNVFRFDFMGERELTDTLNGKDCYTYVASLRDMIWLSPVLCDSNNIYVECSSSMTEDHVFPDIKPGYYILVVNSGFLSEEQKEEYNASGTFTVSPIGLPQMMMTVGDFIKMIEKDTDLELMFIDEYNTFIGKIELYECTLE